MFGYADYYFIHFHIFNSFIFFFTFVPSLMQLATAHRTLNGSVSCSVLPVTTAVGESECEEATGFYETL